MIIVKYAVLGIAGLIMLVWGLFVVLTIIAELPEHETILDEKQHGACYALAQESVVIEVDVSERSQSYSWAANQAQVETVFDLLSGWHDLLEGTRLRIKEDRTTHSIPAGTRFRLLQGALAKEWGETRLRYYYWFEPIDSSPVVTTLLLWSTARPLAVSDPDNPGSSDSSTKPDYTRFEYHPPFVLCAD